MGRGFWIRRLSTSRLADAMMSRRTSLQRAGAFTSAALAFPVFQPGSRYKLGLQLYTMRAAIARDVEAR
jgi:hypothetical protein